MERLKKFSKYGNIKKKIIIGIYAFLIIGIILTGTTYAIYQHETEVTFINAKVRFPTSSEISYTNTSNSNITNVEQALNDLYERLGN